MRPKLVLDNMYIILYIMYIILYILRVALNLINNLRKLRFEHDGISQQDLANAVGVTRLTIHSIEAGKFNPSTLLALKLAKFFGMCVEEIFSLAEEESGK